MAAKLNLNADYCISLGIDGPNVSKRSENKLNGNLRQKNKELISVGTYPSHTVSNAFLEGLKGIMPEINLNQFAIGLHGFFKYYAK